MPQIFLENFVEIREFRLRKILWSPHFRYLIILGLFYAILWRVSFFLQGYSERQSEVSRINNNMEIIHYWDVFWEVL